MRATWRAIGENNFSPKTEANEQNQSREGQESGRQRTLTQPPPEWSVKKGGQLGGRMISVFEKWKRRGKGDVNILAVILKVETGEKRGDGESKREDGSD